MKRTTLPRSLSAGLTRCVLMLLPLAVGGGCNSKPPDKPAAPGPEAQAQPPTVGKPERKTLHYAIRQPGQIEAFEQTALYPKIAGYVSKVNVDIQDPLTGPQYDEKGQVVKPGTLLAELSIPELDVQLKEKEALVREADAKVKQARELVAVADANTRSAEAKLGAAEAGRPRALAEQKRAKTQYDLLNKAGREGSIDKNSIAAALYESEGADAGVFEVVAKIKSAEADRDESQANLSKARADVTVAEEHLEVAKQQRDEAKTLVEYTRIEAPYDGVVVKRNVNTKDFYQPAASGGEKGDPLFVVAKVDPVRIFLEVPETDAVLVGKDTPARVRVRGLRDEELGGKVARTSWSLGTRARTLWTEIDVKNPDHSLRPGMYADVTIQVQREAWALPAAALVTKDAATFCYRVDEDGKAVHMPVRAGIRDGDTVEVLKKQMKPAKPGEEGVWEDLKGDEKIVLSNAESLKEGQEIPTPNSGK
jgi:HlyD family secretion protein